MAAEVRAVIAAGAPGAALEVAHEAAPEVATVVSTVAVRAVGAVQESPIARCVAVAVPVHRHAPEVPRSANEDETTRCVRVL